MADSGIDVNNSSRGDNYYLHTVSWRGNSYLIEFTYSTDWNFQVGDWGAVLTKSYSVYMPADYDGLVFAAQAEPDTYQESARKMQLDSISPKACVLDLDTLEPYSICISAFVIKGEFYEEKNRASVSSKPIKMTDAELSKSWDIIRQCPSSGSGWEWLAQ